MTRLKKLAARLRAVWNGEAVHQDIDEELRIHIRMRTEENIARGMSPEDARRDAEQRFGNSGHIKDLGWDVRGGGWLETFWQDIRYGSRMLRKHPGFSLMAVVTLALGIGANTAIFSIVNGVLLRPLPYPEPDQLDTVFQQNSPTNRFGISVADFQGIEKEYQKIGSVAALSNRAVTLTGGEHPEQVKATFATAAFFQTLGITPARGRAFVPGEDRPGADPVVVISHGFWQSHLAGNTETIGRRLMLDGIGYTVIGILPPDFVAPSRTTPDLWPILQLQPPKRRGPFTLRVIARRNNGVSWQQGQEELQRIAPGVFAQWANTYPDPNATYVSTPLKQALIGDIRPTLLVLFGAVGCVLLLASVNVANLLLARASTRQQEIAIRAALGAGRLRLVRQLFTESMLLALLGGAAGLLLAVWGVDMLLALSPETIPRMDQVRVDGSVLGFAALGTVVSCLVFGLVPALYNVNPDLGEPLKGGGRGSAEVPGRRRLRDLLVIMEFALALPLLVGAGLMINSFVRLQQVKPGFDPDRLLTMQLPLAAQKYPETQQAINFQKELIRRIPTLPGIQSASLSTDLPLEGGHTNNFNLEIRPTPPGTPEDVAEFFAVSPEYFRTLGIPLLKGRYLTDHDDENAPPVMVVSEAMARRYFPGQDPIGMRLKTGGCTECDWTTIVGVVGDVKNDELNTEDDSAMYCPFTQEPSRTINLILRTEGDPANFVATVRREVNSIDPDLALANIKTMDQLMSKSLGQSRYRGVLLGIFATVALILAAVGIYGVIAYAVSQRTREIGIRIALGARRWDIFRMVVGHGLILSLIGVGIGVTASLLLTRYLASLLFAVSSTDPATFTSVVLLLITVALLACSIPARRATRVDPMNALRHE
ncbi:MAG TPA: ABC transporter permease [Pyrinomonadaceae bacterium]|jgi:putative ABC transport system permease protein|nr:ABC transporter permease [Pyrinomonadaceae bacterium]